MLKRVIAICLSMLAEASTEPPFVAAILVE
jgi:hypothetical protein